MSANRRKKAINTNYDNVNDLDRVDPDAPPRRTSLPQSRLRELERNWSRLSKQRALSPLMDGLLLRDEHRDFAANIPDVPREEPSPEIYSKLEAMKETSLEEQSYLDESPNLLTNIESLNNLMNSVQIKPELPSKNTTREVTYRDETKHSSLPPPPRSPRETEEEEYHELGLKVELDHTHIKAGETISGYLIAQCLESRKPLFLSYIYMHLKGIEMFDSPINDYKVKKQFLSMKIDLLSNLESDSMLIHNDDSQIDAKLSLHQNQQIKIPFQFQLPEDLPSSITFSNMAQVKYLCEGVVQVVDGGKIFTYKEKKEAEVDGVLSQEGLSQDAQQKQVTSTSWNFMSGNGKAALTAWVDKAIYYTTKKDYAKITVRVNNQTGKKLQGLNLRLIGTCIPLIEKENMNSSLINQRGSFKPLKQMNKKEVGLFSKMVKKLIFDEKAFQFPSGKATFSTVLLPIPLSAKTITQSGLFRIEWNVHMSINMGKFKKPLCCQIPIKIASGFPKDYLGSKRLPPLELNESSFMDSSPLNQALNLAPNDDYLNKISRIKEQQDSQLQSVHQTNQNFEQLAHENSEVIDSISDDDIPLRSSFITNSISTRISSTSTKSFIEKISQEIAENRSRKKVTTKRSNSKNTAKHFRSQLSRKLSKSNPDLSKDRSFYPQKMQEFHNVSNNYRPSNLSEEAPKEEVSPVVRVPIPQEEAITFTPMHTKDNITRNTGFRTVDESNFMPDIASTQSQMYIKNTFEITDYDVCPQQTVSIVKAHSKSLGLSIEEMGTQVKDSIEEREELWDEMPSLISNVNDSIFLSPQQTIDYPPQQTIDHPFSSNQSRSTSQPQQSVQGSNGQAIVIQTEHGSTIYIPQTYNAGLQTLPARDEINSLSYQMNDLTSLKSGGFVPSNIQLGDTYTGQDSNHTKSKGVDGTINKSGEGDQTSAPYIKESSNYKKNSFTSSGYLSSTKPINTKEGGEVNLVKSYPICTQCNRLMEHGLIKEDGFHGVEFDNDQLDSSDSCVCTLPSLDHTKSQLSLKSAAESQSCAQSIEKSQSQVSVKPQTQSDIKSQSISNIQSQVASNSDAKSASQSSMKSLINSGLESNIKDGVLSLDGLSNELHDQLSSLCQHSKHKKDFYIACEEVNRIKQELSDVLNKAITLLGLMEKRAKPDNFDQLLDQSMEAAEELEQLNSVHKCSKCHLEKRAKPTEKPGRSCDPMQDTPNYTRSVTNSNYASPTTDQSGPTGVSKIIEILKKNGTESQYITNTKEPIQIMSMVIDNSNPPSLIHDMEDQANNISLEISRKMEQSTVLLSGFNEAILSSVQSQQLNSTSAHAESTRITDRSTHISSIHSSNHQLESPAVQGSVSQKRTPITSQLSLNNQSEAVSPHISTLNQNGPVSSHISSDNQSGGSSNAQFQPGLSQISLHSQSGATSILNGSAKSFQISLKDGNNSKSAQYESNKSTGILSGPLQSNDDSSIQNESAKSSQIDESIKQSSENKSSIVDTSSSNKSNGTRTALKDESSTVPPMSTQPVHFTNISITSKGQLDANSIIISPISEASGCLSNLSNVQMGANSTKMDAESVHLSNQTFSNSKLNETRQSIASEYTRSVTDTDYADSKGASADPQMSRDGNLKGGQFKAKFDISSKSIKSQYSNYLSSNNLISTSMQNMRPASHFITKETQTSILKPLKKISIEETSQQEPQISNIDSNQLLSSVVDNNGQSIKTASYTRSITKTGIPNLISESQLASELKSWTPSTFYKSDNTNDGSGGKGSQSTMERRTLREKPSDMLLDSEITKLLFSASGERTVVSNPLPSQKHSPSNSRYSDGLLKTEENEVQSGLCLADKEEQYENISDLNISRPIKVKNTSSRPISLIKLQNIFNSVKSNNVAPMSQNLESAFTTPAYTRSVTQSDLADECMSFDSVRFSMTSALQSEALGSGKSAFPPIDSSTMKKSSTANSAGWESVPSDIHPDESFIVPSSKSIVESTNFTTDSSSSNMVNEMLRDKLSKITSIAQSTPLEKEKSIDLGLDYQSSYSSLRKSIPHEMESLDESSDQIIRNKAIFNLYLDCDSTKYNNSSIRLHAPVEQGCTCCPQLPVANDTMDCSMCNTTNVIMKSTGEACCSMCDSSLGIRPDMSMDLSVCHEEAPFQSPISTTAEPSTSFVVDESHSTHEVSVILLIEYFHSIEKQADHTVQLILKLNRGNTPEKNRLIQSLVGHLQHLESEHTKTCKLLLKIKMETLPPPEETEVKWTGSGVVAKLDDWILHTNSSRSKIHTLKPLPLNADNTNNVVFALNSISEMPKSIFDDLKLPVFDVPIEEKEDKSVYGFTDYSKHDLAPKESTSSDEAPAENEKPLHQVFIESFTNQKSSPSTEIKIESSKISTETKVSPSLSTLKLTTLASKVSVQSLKEVLRKPSVYLTDEPDSPSLSYTRSVTETGSLGDALLQEYTPVQQPSTIEVEEPSEDLDTSAFTRSVTYTGFQSESVKEDSLTPDFTRSVTNTEFEQELSSAFTSVLSPMTQEQLIEKSQAAIDNLEKLTQNHGRETSKSEEFEQKLSQAFSEASKLFIQTLKESNIIPQSELQVKSGSAFLDISSIDKIEAALTIDSFDKVEAGLQIEDQNTEPGFPQADMDEQTPYQYDYDQSQILETIVGNFPQTNFEEQTAYNYEYDNSYVSISSDHNLNDQLKLSTINDPSNLIAASDELASLIIHDKFGAKEDTMKDGTMMNQTTESNGSMNHVLNMRLKNILSRLDQVQTKYSSSSLDLKNSVQKIDFDSSSLKLRLQKSPSLSLDTTTINVQPLTSPPLLSPTRSQNGSLRRKTSQSSAKSDNNGSPGLSFPKSTVDESNEIVRVLTGSRRQSIIDNF